ncbi:hypothetical protein [Reyranella sp. CPCC 100927]|uniref:hypothetical protein n=1 Tax=Reyranella sp. CPCC 100927 TaxID=2599616 RepID=UPI0011B5ED99|nr:hypothetical protein [Reyranella sp. CPCC 100927]TWT03057.1 hypothetical protein FQU96_28365 [Reyranella sp. CPCC 100927]
MADLHELVSRYVAVWNEPDPVSRRQQIAALWADDGSHFTPNQDYHGYTALETRITGAYDKWVRDGGHVFRPRDPVDGHHDTVRFQWEMVRDNTVVSVGFDFLLLGEDGRIRADYQFLDQPPTA